MICGCRYCDGNAKCVCFGYCFVYSWQILLSLLHSMSQESSYKRRRYNVSKACFTYRVRKKFWNPLVQWTTEVLVLLVQTPSLVVLGCRVKSKLQCTIMDMKHKPYGLGLNCSEQQYCSFDMLWWPGESMRYFPPDPQPMYKELGKIHHILVRIMYYPQEG